MTTEIFNREELLEDIDGDWEFLRETVDMLHEDGTDLIDKIRRGVDMSDAESVWQNAHTMKSMIGNFAATRAFDLAYGVETCGRAGDLDAIGANVDALEQEMNLLVTALNELLSSVGG